MSHALRILLVEDNADDADLLLLALLGEGMACAIQRVETRPELEQALSGPAPDIVICDGHLPGFDGMQAHAWIRAAWPSVPFVFCLGSMIYGPALQAMTDAADACIDKHRLHELPSLLRRLLD